MLISFIKLSIFFFVPIASTPSVEIDIYSILKCYYVIIVDSYNKFIAKGVENLPEYHLYKNTLLRIQSSSNLKLINNQLIVTEKTLVL